MKKIFLPVILIFVLITICELQAQTYTETQSSQWSSCAGSYANLNDGTLSTIAGTNGSASEWILATFAAPENVTAVTVGASASPTCGWGSMASYMNGAVIQSSPNNSMWTTQATIGGVVDGGTTTFTFPVVTAQYWRIWKGGWIATSEFTFTFGAPPSPMAYSSSTTTQSTFNTSQGAANQQIIGIQIVTTGSTSPLSATSFTFNTTGSTNPPTDITNAKVFSTGTSSAFGTTTQFGSTYANPNGSFTITGSTTLSTGTNYFWLTYDIASGATLNNVVDAQCTSLIVGAAYAPTVTAPAGSRTIATLPVALMASGGNHTLAVCNDGTVRAWGWDGNGQLGDNATLLEKYNPVQVSGLTGITAVAAGYQHSLALKNDGTVWAWGNNGNGQLGDGTSGSPANDKATPVAVNLASLGGRTVTALAAGDWHSILLCSDGTVWAWGYGLSGQLGDGFGVDRTTPVQASGLTGITAIAGGRQHSLALKNDNTVWAFGLNLRGELGDNTTIDRWTPTQVHGLADVGFLTGITAIAAGDWRSLAVKSDGTAWAWGENSVGGIGDGTTTERHTPVQVSGLANAVAVAGGNGHSFALKNDGTVWAWGYNLSGQLGINSISPGSPCSIATGSNCEWTPVQVRGTGNVGFLTGITLIAGSRGQFHSMSLKSDGTVWGWGYDIWGQLGDNNTSPKYTPVQPIGLCVVAVLPVGLISFDAHCTENKNSRLEWATSSEMNNDFFSIEKSGDGKTWDVIGTVKGAGNSSVTQNYEFVDPELPTPDSQLPTLYYRLKQTDYDGKFEYKQPMLSVASHCIDSKNQLIIFPNPVGDKLSFQFYSDEQNEITIEVYDVCGKSVVKKLSLVSKGKNLFTFDIQDISKGIYMLSVKTKSSATHQKFIRQ